MPRILPTTPHLHATLIFTRANVVQTCTVYYNIPGQSSVNEGNIQQIANNLYDHWKDAVAAVLPTSVTFTGVLVKLMGTVIEHQAHSDVVAITGSVASVDPLPEHDCISIQRLTGFKGPKNRGRIYFPFVPETFVLDSALTTAGLAAYKAVATRMSAFVAAVEGDETPLMIAAHIVWKDGEINNISHCRVQPEVKTIKRRRAPKRSFAVSAPQNPG